MQVTIAVAIVILYGVFGFQGHEAHTGGLGHFIETAGQLALFGFAVIIIDRAIRDKDKDED